MLLLVVLFWFGVGRGYSWWPLDPADEAAGKKKFANAQFKLDAWERYAEVNPRPLFNEDRRPTPPMPADAPAGEAKPIPKLDVVLAGVIMTSKVRLAMVKEKGKEKSMTVKEGGALPGELAAWTLAEVKSRSAVFKNSAGEQATVELIPVASSQKPTPPPPPRVPATPPPATGQPQVPGQAPPLLPAAGQPPGPDAVAAADLQQRIDARRQQIREQQQQQQQQQGQAAEPPPQPPQQQQ
jgi:general secretion pathway protein N